MEFFLHKPAHECPKIMVSTHYSELVRKFSAMAGVQTLSMQFLVTEHTDETNVDDLVFLFKCVFQCLMQNYAAALYGDTFPIGPKK